MEQEIKDAWAERMFVGITQEETYQRNFKALGEVDILRRLQEATVEEMYE